MLLFGHTPSWRSVLLTVCCAAVIGFGGRRTLPTPRQTRLRRRAPRLMRTQSSPAHGRRHRYEWCKVRGRARPMSEGRSCGGSERQGMPPPARSRHW
jgi:hypothetical protein